MFQPQAVWLASIKALVHLHCHLFHHWVQMMCLPRIQHSQWTLMTMCHCHLHQDVKILAFQNCGDRQSWLA
jgi:hypothetical protein